MVVLQRRERRGPILTPSSLPCLRQIPTINITEGCAHGCTYCYTQGYSNYPGAGRLVLFDNIPKLVRAELARKRRQPRRVYFSPSSDAFQPVPEVQEVTYQTMAILLAAGIEVAFLTKGVPEDRFFALFAGAPSRVFAQVGITALGESQGRLFEPGAPSPSRRLETIEALVRIGVATTARLDPLMPDLTDTDANLVPLLAELARRKVRHVAASYLFVRPAFTSALTEKLRAVAASPDPTSGWAWRAFADGVGGGRMLGTKERCRRLLHLQDLAAGHGIEVHVCACKNPDVPGAGGCQIAGRPPGPPSTNSAPLFDQGAVPCDGHSSC